MANDQPSDAELFDLLEADEVEMSVVISNPHAPDNPMIYVSEEFERQTGYAVEDVEGACKSSHRGADLLSARAA